MRGQLAPARLLPIHRRPGTGHLTREGWKNSAVTCGPSTWSTSGWPPGPGRSRERDLAGRTPRGSADHVQPSDGGL